MPLLSAREKSFPPAAHGRSLESFLAGDPRRSDFATPLLTLDRGAMQHNVALMAEWARAAGVRLAPHGKTTMAPDLWRALIDAGAWGLTFATAWQAQAARAHGVRRILIANEVVDPIALRWIADELSADPEVEILCWADGVDAVHAMDAAIGDTARPLQVLVELGGAGGRTGARDRATAGAIAEAIVASPVLELAGVGGYEGALAHDRAPASIARIDAYLVALAELHRELVDAGMYPEGVRPVVSAGGSAYFDRVGVVLPQLCAGADVVVRSGAFQIHDDGFYSGISPMGREIGDEPFRSAMHVWARVLSRPEPGLALLDCGRRDASFDEGLPVAQRLAGRPGDDAVLVGSVVTAMNDQHLFLRLSDDVAAAGGADRLRVGDVVRLGLSHPCTALDKWRLIPVVADADADDPVVVAAVETWF
ncbi:amino acid deaminase [Microbacterium panaciterrae]|uniref:Amino acid deaminase n=1 Tax=Microbacterium panaciterrae TaxID=985759 RepID=A0ABP8PRY2_9MICO